MTVGKLYIENVSLRTNLKIVIMKALRVFSIPIKGLGIGKHSFEYKLESDFFKNFEDSEIKSGSYSIQVELDKQIRMMEFNFFIQGYFEANCDRCLEEIKIPTKSNDRLLVKLEAETEEESEEVIYIDDNEQDFNLAPFIYEFIHLSKPLKNVIDCEENDFEHCDQNVLDKMEFEEERNDNDPMWDQLKNIELG